MKEKLKLFDRTDLLGHEFFEKQSKAIMDKVAETNRDQAQRRSLMLDSHRIAEASGRDLQEDYLTGFDIRQMANRSAYLKKEIGILLYKVKKD